MFVSLGSKEIIDSQNAKPAQYTQSVPNTSFGSIRTLAGAQCLADVFTSSALPCVFHSFGAFACVSGTFAFGDVHS